MSSIIDNIMNAFSRLSGRERRLVLITIAVALILFVFGGAYFVSSSLDSKRKRVELRREQLAQILSREGKYNEAAKSEKDDARKLRGNNISLFSLLQKSAGELGLPLNDLNERKSPLRNNTSITEITVDVNLKKVSVDKFNAL